MAPQMLSPASPLHKAITPGIVIALLLLVLPGCQSLVSSAGPQAPAGPEHTLTAADESPRTAETPGLDSAPPGGPSSISTGAEDYQTHGSRQEITLIDEAFDNQGQLDEVFASGAAAAGFRSDWGSASQRQSSQMAPPDGNMGGRPYRPIIGVDSKGGKSLQLQVYPLTDFEKTAETISLIQNSNGVMMHSSAMTIPLPHSYRKIRFLYDIKPPQTTGISDLWGSVWLVPAPGGLKAQGITGDETKRILSREKLEFDLSEFLADFRHEGSTVLMVVAHDHTKAKNPSWIISMADFRQKLAEFAPKSLPAPVGAYAPGDWIHVEADLDYQTDQVVILYNGNRVLDTLADGQKPPRLQASTVDGNLANIDFNLVISLVPGSSAYGWPGSSVVDPQVSKPYGEMFVRNLKVLATP